MAKAALVAVVAQQRDGTEVKDATGAHGQHGRGRRRRSLHGDRADGEMIAAVGQEQPLAVLAIVEADDEAVVSRRRAQGNEQAVTVVDAFACLPAVGGAALAHRLTVPLGHDLVALVQQLQRDFVAALDRRRGLPDQADLHDVAGDGVIVQHGHFA